MWKNKKLLMFLVLNSLVLSFSEETVQSKNKYDELYNSMTESIKNNESTQKNYEFIENILNQRNKELKDLYKQSDYIVKPEYLEWQIFFSAFYESRHGDNNTRGNSAYTNGKPYLPELPPKTAKIRPSIEFEYINVIDRNININLPEMSSINKIEVIKSMPDILEPLKYDVPIINVEATLPEDVESIAVNVTTPVIITNSFSDPNSEFGWGGSVVNGKLYQNDFSGVYVFSKTPTRNGIPVVYNSLVGVYNPTTGVYDYSGTDYIGVIVSQPTAASSVVQLVKELSLSARNNGINSVTGPVGGGQTFGQISVLATYTPTQYQIIDNDVIINIDGYRGRNLIGTDHISTDTASDRSVGINHGIINVGKGTVNISGNDSYLVQGIQIHANSQNNYIEHDGVINKGTINIDGYVSNGIGYRSFRSATFGFIENTYKGIIDVTGEEKAFAITRPASEGSPNPKSAEESTNTGIYGAAAPVYNMGKVVVSGQGQTGIYVHSIKADGTALGAQGAYSQAEAQALLNLNRRGQVINYKAPETGTGNLDTNTQTTNYWQDIKIENNRPALGEAVVPGEIIVTNNTSKAFNERSKGIFGNESDIYNYGNVTITSGTSESIGIYGGKLSRIYNGDDNLVKNIDIVRYDMLDTTTHLPLNYNNYKANMDGTATNNVNWLQSENIGTSANIEVSGDSGRGIYSKNSEVYNNKTGNIFLNTLNNSTSQYTTGILAEATDTNTLFENPSNITATARPKYFLDPSITPNKIINSGNIIFGFKKDGTLANNNINERQKYIGIYGLISTSSGNSKDMTILNNGIISDLDSTGVHASQNSIGIAAVNNGNYGDNTMLPGSPGVVKNSALTVTNNNGSIIEIGDLSLGIYGENRLTGTGSTVMINNFSNINLGKGSKGIIGKADLYNASQNIITNTGIITTDSYSDNDNSGDFSAGDERSIGVYLEKFHGVFSLNSLINVNDHGLGVYIKDSGILNSGSAQSLTDPGLDFQSGNIYLRNGRTIGIYLDGTSSAATAQLKAGTAIISDAPTTALPADSSSIGIILMSGNAQLENYGEINLLNYKYTQPTGVNLENKVGSLGIYLSGNSGSEPKLYMNGTINTGQYGTGLLIENLLTGSNIELTSSNIKAGDFGTGIYLNNSLNTTQIQGQPVITVGTKGIAINALNSSIDINAFKSTNMSLGNGSIGYYLGDGSIINDSGTNSLDFSNFGVVAVALKGNNINYNIQDRDIIVGDESDYTINLIDDTGAIVTKSGNTPPIGLYIEEVNTLGIGGTGEIRNKIVGGLGAIGIYYRDITPQALVYSGTGANDIVVGRSGMSLDNSVGVYASGQSGTVDNITFNNTHIKVQGLGSIGIAAENGARVVLNGGKVELTDGGILFYKKSNGDIIVNGTQLITSTDGIELFRIIDSQHNNTINLGLTKNSIAIHGETSEISNTGSINSNIVGGVKVTNNTGIYIENSLYALNSLGDVIEYSDSAGFPVAGTNGLDDNYKEFLNPRITSAQNLGTIDLGDSGKGIYGNYSEVENGTNGIIKIENQGAGIFLNAGNTAVNNGVIEIGEKSVGIYVKQVLESNRFLDSAKNVVSSINQITNNGKINSTGDESVGIYVKTDDTGTVRETQKSSINLTGNSDIELTGNSTVGIYSDKTDINLNGKIKVGNGVLQSGVINYAIGVYSKDGDLIINSGEMTGGNKSIGFIVIGEESNTNMNVNTQNISLGADSVFYYAKGIGAYRATINDSSNSNYILDKNNQILYYVENGDVQSNSQVSVKEGTGSLGAYISNTGNNMSLSGLTLNIEENQKGIYVQSDVNANSVTDLDVLINLTGSNGIGILQKEGIVNSLSSMQVTGNGAVGAVISDNDGTQTGEFLNRGNIEIFGDNSVGIYGTTKNEFMVLTNGKLELLNDAGAVIKIADKNNPANGIIGIYGDGDTLIKQAGNIEVGKNGIGVYAEDNTAGIDSTGNLKISANGIGYYLEPSSMRGLSGTIKIDDGQAIGIFGGNGSNIDIQAPMIFEVGDINSSILNPLGSFGIVGKDGTNILNSGEIKVGNGSVGIYETDSVVKNFGRLVSSGSSINENSVRVMIYGNKGGNIINESTGFIDAGDFGVGIYENGKNYLLTIPSVENRGVIKAGDSYYDPVSGNEFHSIGIYGEASSIKNMTASSQITVGTGGIGIYSYNPSGDIINEGTINSISPRSVGIFAERLETPSILSREVINSGNIILTGDNSVGISVNTGTNVTNKGLIDVSGANSIGIYADMNTRVVNDVTGVINAMGSNGIGILLRKNSVLENYGIINIDVNKNGRAIVTDDINNVKVAGTSTVYLDTNAYPPLFYLESGNTYDLPTIINAGIIKVNENFDTSGIKVIVKVNPDTIRPATNPEDLGAKFVSDAVQFQAPSFSIRNLEIASDFTQGTNTSVYKLENVFDPTTPNGGINSGTTSWISESLLWEVIPDENSLGNLDLWLKRRSITDFTDGLWYAGFGEHLEAGYEDSIGNAGKIYDKLDLITNEADFRQIMASLAGNVYANINQREDDIAKTFENSLDFMENSKNNTKENVKVNVIVGKGKNSEDTDGVVGYDYSTAGVLGLREVERTYRHTFGYSLGYLHTGFEFNDGNDSEEWVDTIQLGVHSKYNLNDWKLRNDLTGRISFHNVDRNIDWTAPNGRSEMNGMFETYSITSDNILGREFALGKNTSITPYGAVRAMYVTRPSFNESGLESLEVEGNDAWSVKPRAGIELKAVLPLGPRTAWQLKGTLDFAYEYELADLNEREKARLIAVEDGYHDLSKPEDEKGTFRTRAALGAEVEDRYGIFLTGEYGIGNSDQDDYRAGVTLKAVF